LFFFAAEDAKKHKCTLKEFQGDPPPSFNPRWSPWQPMIESVSNFNKHIMFEMLDFIIHRLLLCVIHYNCNFERPQATMKDGKSSGKSIQSSREVDTV
jgi:hypothetical protein